MISFTDNFWGEKNNGFDVLYHNMKHGQVSSKELSDFLRESCSVEESYSKLLTKLAKVANNNSQNGSFAPFWQVLKALAEKLSSLHMQLMHSWQDLIKDVQKYTEEQHKKHKSVKESESSTIETVQSIQTTTVALQKAKDLYHTRSIEYEKLKRDNASAKEVEKAEVKCKKAGDDYKGLVEKYNNIRNDFETKIFDACNKFQEIETMHIQQMKSFLATYAKGWEGGHTLIGQVHETFRNSLDELNEEKLLETFVENKKTGAEKPGLIQFEEPDLSSLPAATSSTSLESQDKAPVDKPKPLSLGAITYIPGFKKKKDKRDKKKKKDKKKGKDQVEQEERKTPEVDEDGFSIRPENPLGDKDGNSWYSSSDSDSDGEEKKKIKVEIKPVNSTAPVATGNVDDIRISVGSLRLSPTHTKKPMKTNNSDANMKRSQSVSDTLGNSKMPSQDLLGLDLFGLSSSASTPTGTTYTFPSPNNSLHNDTTSNTSRDNTPSSNPLFNLDESGSSEGGTIAPSLPNKQRPRSTTPTAGSSLFPAPPPRLAAPRKISGPQSTSRPTGRQSPAAPFTRADSSGSLGSVTFNTTSMPTGSSRGPSPLTIGMSDTIPIAIAFTEQVNALFQGSDETKCKVKSTGDVTISFPTGIVKALLDNPNPSVLTFRMKNVQSLQDIVVNKQLVTEETSQSTSQCRVYSFDMPNLSEHLRKQHETNQGSSYFNIDILKYQIIQSGIQSTPLHLTTYWKCEPHQTDFRLDYTYNGAAISQKSPLSNVTVTCIVTGDVTNMQAKPSGIWNGANKRAVWKLPDISDMNEDGGQGCLRAKFDLAAGPTNPSAVAVQFTCENSSLSGIDFELAGGGYRLSLAKKRFTSGRYMVQV
ncbi:unnamed protein product [Owenia fusiformis]|uniref:F-BAR domain only protein 2 n=1 Tax=Owenia fusiformis TaxID=6347 RepID=A0A8S4N3K0_OWEFU|nr:unnamed protein product [Owenia fusiformis]